MQSADKCISRHPPLSVVRWLAPVYLADEWWLQPLVAILCGLLTIERSWSRDHATSSVTAVLPPLGQCCGTVCLNSFSNQTSPSDNSNDCWKRLCLVSWAMAPCVWTLRALTRNLLGYLLTDLHLFEWGMARNNSYKQLKKIKVTQFSRLLHKSSRKQLNSCSAGKAKAGMVHSINGGTRGVQVKLWDTLRTSAIPPCLT